MIDERFMESCIEESPSVFLGRPVQVVSRQPRLSGYRPDLICREGEKILIVEIQQHALDRSHLYRCIEYRDLYIASSDKNNKPSITIICNEINTRYSSVLETHGIELIVISRDKFIDLAAVHCPNSVALLLKQGKAGGSKTRVMEKTSFIFQPLGWYDYIDLDDLIRHIYREIGSNGVDLSQLRNGYYWSILHEVEQIIFETSEHSRLEDILDPRTWNIDKLISKSTVWEPDILKDILRIRKPNINLNIVETARGNLRISWRPHVESYSSHSRYNTGDWAIWSGDEPYGWTNPPNELMFIRDINRLSPCKIHDRLEQIDCNWDVLDELFVALIKKTYDYIHDRLSAIVAVEKVNDIELELIEANTADFEDDDIRYFGIGSRRRIVDWSIYNVKGKIHEAEQKWIADFSASYGISIEDFLTTYKVMS